MRRRAFLIAGGVAALPLAGLGVLMLSAEDDARAQEEAELRRVLTDVEPLQERLPGLGRIVAAHWTEEVSRRAGDRLPIGPADFLVNAFLRLEPGAVARLASGARTEPAVLPAFRAAGVEALDGWGLIPAQLAEFAPSGAAWRRPGPGPDNPDSEFWYDSASDTVYLRAINLHKPAAASPSASAHSSASAS